jgi:hypothetical protein
VLWFCGFVVETTRICSFCFLCSPLWDDLSMHTCFVEVEIEGSSWKVRLGLVTGLNTLRLG